MIINRRLPVGSPSLHEFAEGGFDVRVPEECHPGQDRGVGSVVEEHVPQLLGTDIGDSEFRISCCIQRHLRCYKQSGWVRGSVFCECQLISIRLVNVSYAETHRWTSNDGSRQPVFPILRLGGESNS